MNITNDIITAYLDTLYVNKNQKLKELREFAEKERVPIILKDTEELLLQLIRIKKPAKVLEIGTAVGYSACCFADAYDCQVVTIEADDEMADIAESNIRNLGFENKVEVLRGDAREVMADLKGNTFDVVFIDAAKSHYLSFWNLALPLCRPDAVIICDNVLMKGMTASDEYDTKGKYNTSIRKMREFLIYINEQAETSVLPVGDGISISLVE
ncbi:MAG: O-methyltransferase [Lentihominibacter sp.]|jgi:predicted O-methyltransferase YrrM